MTQHLGTSFLRHNDARVDYVVRSYFFKCQKIMEQSLFDQMPFLDTGLTNMLLHKLPGCVRDQRGNLSFPVK